MFGSPPGRLRDRLRAALATETPRERTAAGSVSEQVDLSSLGGNWFETGSGPGYVIESRYDGGHSHGTIALHHALAVDTARLAGQVRDPRVAEQSPAAYLFIDTETTGLGGAGAMVFLAGVARFEGSTLVLRQYLLPTPAFEAGLLGGLADELDRAGALVSFNGKSFDLPQLESRAILARRRPSWRSLPHIDLLHPNRRLFRGSFDGHRLVHLETRLLGFEREDDCPSAEVPLRYFRFQATGDPTWIRPVLRHNAWDILSLVALVAHLGTVCAGEAGELQAGRAAAYERDWPRAAHHFAGAFASATRRAERLEAGDAAARALTRIGRYDEAASIWRALIDDRHNRRLVPYVELAKLLEHRLRAPAEAARVTAHAISLVDRGLLRPGRPSTETGAAELRHRHERLLKRSARTRPTRTLPRTLS